MRIGLCTTDLTPAAPEALLNRVADYGFTAVQLAFDSIPIDGFQADTRIEIPEKVPTDILRTLDRTAASRKLSIVAVNGTFNMAHPDKEVRAEGIRRYAGFLDASQALGVRYVSVCTGSRNPAHLWRPHPDNRTEAAWQDMRETMAACSELAAKRNMTLMVEVEASNVVDTPEKARRLMDDLGETVKIVLDPANLFHPGQAYPENVRPILDHADSLLHDDIVLAHGKDIRKGDGLDFCGAGEGIVDFAYLTAKIPSVEAILLHSAFRDEAIRAGLTYLSSVASAG